MKNSDGKQGGGAGDLDLFGYPMRPIRDPRGRPSFAKTKENQETVATLAAAGWNAEQIGPYLGCDPQTVRKHFSRELEHGAKFIEGMAMQVLVKRMKDGHAPSAARVMEIARASNAPRSLRPSSKLPGLKEQRRQAAHQPTQEWGDLLPQPPQRLQN